MRKLLILTLFFLSATVFGKTVSLNAQGRNYKLVIPEQGMGKRPLIVLLHGCKQDPDLLLAGTDMESEAQKRNLFLLVPEQSFFHNIDHCWNWFLPFEQKRHPSSEMGQIISMLEMMTKQYPADAKKLYVVGMSAGGALAHSFLACYPDVFKGVAIHSGLAFKTAESIQEANQILTSVDQKSPQYLGHKAFECSGLPADKHNLEKLMIVHGEDDPRVNPIHAQLIFDATKIMMDAAGGDLETELHYVKGLAHAWGGGKPVSPNFDPKAPSSTRLILNFFNL